MICIQYWITLEHKRWAIVFQIDVFIYFYVCCTIAYLRKITRRIKKSASLGKYQPKETLEH
jgi:hypothetical protein